VLEIYNNQASIDLAAWFFFCKYNYVIVHVKKIMDNRNYSIDTLRSIAGILVVILHISAYYVNTGMTENNFGLNFQIANILDSFSRICVPLFVMISGRFLLEKKDEAGKFYRKRLGIILIPMLFWSVIYSVYTLLGFYVIKGELRIMPIILSFVQGTPYYHLWYLFMLIGLYAATPFIRKVLANKSNTQLIVIASVLFVISMLLDFSEQLLKITTPFIFWFIKYISYFILGYVLANIRKVNTILLIATYGIASMLTCFSTIITSSAYHNLLFYSYLSPTVFIAAISFYKIFLQITIKENILSKISNLIFGIYLIHVGILNILTIIFEKKMILNNIIIEFPLKFVLTLGISYILAYILEMNRITKRLI
jgi:surface polysaccharide O-acyltransferase-like enzyme